MIHLLKIQPNIIDKNKPKVTNIKSCQNSEQKIKNKNKNKNYRCNKKKLEEKQSLLCLSWAGTRRRWSGGEPSNVVQWWKKEDGGRWPK